METDGDLDLKEEERFFFNGDFQSKSKLSSISCRGRIDWDLVISTTKFLLMNW